jgi:hypothetical protein
VNAALIPLISSCQRDSHRPAADETLLHSELAHKNRELERTHTRVIVANFLSAFKVVTLLIDVETI